MEARQTRKGRIEGWNGINSCKYRADWGRDAMRESRCLIDRMD